MSAHLPLSWLTADAKLLLLARALRSFGNGSVAVLLAIYLHLIGFSLVQIGLFISAGLAGATLLSTLIVVAAESFGRRRLEPVMNHDFGRFRQGETRRLPNPGIGGITPNSGGVHNTLYC